MDPLVSVIVPVYNVRNFLEEALDSVISQTYQNLEILVIDDGSTDGSSDLCDLYEQKDQRIKVFHQGNKGLSAARNVGLDHMTGDLVAFLDPDDAYESEMIRTMVQALQNMDADIVKCGVNKQKTEGKLKKDEKDKNDETENWKVLSRREALIALVYGEINTAVWNKIYQRKLWDDFRFQEGVLIEDVKPAYLLLNRADRIGIIPEKLVDHRIRPGSISLKIQSKLITDFVNAYEEYELFILANIPAIYTEEHYNFFKVRMLSRIIGKWDQAIRQNPDVAKEIRRETKKRGKEADLSSFSWRLKVKYWMICWIPQLLCLVEKVLLFNKKLRSGTGDRERGL